MVFSRDVFALASWSASFLRSVCFVPVGWFVRLVYARLFGRFCLCLCFLFVFCFVFVYLI